jgi:hypothetical protein
MESDHAEKPTLLYWAMILQTEILIPVVIRAHRIENFCLYIEALRSLMFSFFAHDHYNYAWWLTIHFRDMKSLPVSLTESFHAHWVVNKTSNRFSAKYMNKKMHV